MEKDEAVAIATAYAKSTWMMKDIRVVSAVPVDNEWFVEFERKGTAVLDGPGFLVTVDRTTGNAEVFETL